MYQRNLFASFLSGLIGLISLLCIGATGWYLFISPGKLRTIIFPPKPCSQPIRYSIGSLDPRFHVSTSTLIEDLRKASGLWSNSAKKTLFEYDPSGVLKINLVYDNRQASTDKLNELGYRISNDQQSYDELKSRLTMLKTDLASQKTTIDRLTQQLDARNAAYEAEVKSWNERGGATPQAYAKLSQEQKDLKATAERLKELVDAYNAQTDQVNALVAVINRIAASLNYKVDQANAVNQNQGKEFEEGEYRVDQTGTEINIYEFDSPERLIRVLAHEFGHALGLDHVNDPKAIMYYLNQSTAASLSLTDVSAVTSLCKSPQ